MRVLMVRHGQSENNLMAEKIGGVPGTDALHTDEHTQQWLSQRYDDPSLTEKGQREAEQLCVRPHTETPTGHTETPHRVPCLLTPRSRPDNLTDALRPADSLHSPMAGGGGWSGRRSTRRSSASWV